MSLQKRFFMMILCCVLLVASAMMTILYVQGHAAQSSTSQMAAHADHLGRINKISLLFKSEVQAWKDVLIRGANPDNMKKYAGELEENSAKIENETKALLPKLSADEAQLANEFLKSQKELTAHYLDAKAAHLEAEKFDPAGAVKAVKGMDRPVLKSLNELSQKLQKRMDDAGDQASQAIASGIRNCLLIGAALTLFVLAMSSWFTRRFARELHEISSTLNPLSHSLSKSSQELATSSEQLASSVDESASSLQETAASLEEVSSMVSRNSEGAENSRQVSAESRKIAERGQETAIEAGRAIHEIAAENELVLRRVREANVEFAKVTQVIGEISKKTAVINEIVLQTRLLSFNASVEAARAGEHGKGFAIVAQEVGNLAEMSGRASKEISDLLTESIGTVDDTVRNTQSSMEKLVSAIHARIESGKAKVEACGDVLQTLAKQISTLDEMSAEIATASNEQAQAIASVSSAVQQLNRATQANAAISTQTSSLGGSMNEHATNLQSALVRLNSTVDGKKAA